MPPARVVQALHVVEDVGTGFVVGAVNLSGHPFGLQRGEEALHRGIVPNIAGPDHRAGYPIVGQRALKLLAGILVFAT